MLSRRKQSKDRTSVNGDAISASDELSRKLEGWSRLKESLYGSSPPTATVRVTVLAATGLMSADPYWVGCCAGSHASTGPSSHFEAGIESAPRGSPSWSSDPIILDIHDLTSDVLLLLCEPSVRDGSHHCVGRIVLPLCDFLPALNPCDGILGGITSPPAHQLWSAIVSPGPECAPKSVAPLLAAAIPGIPGAGLPSPAAAMQQSSTSAEAYDETPPVHGAALVRVEITLHSPLAASLLWSPPFDPSIVPLIDAASGQAVILPQRALIAVHRLSTALTGVPALLQLLALKPWTAGLIILGLSWWLLYGMSAAMLPWWVLLAWGANGVAIRQLASAPSPWEPLSAERGDLGSDDDDGGGEGYRAAGSLISSRELRCAALEATLHPLISSIEATASALERLATAPAVLEPRVAVLSALPIFVLSSLSSALLSALWFVVRLCGGAQSATFLAITLALLLNAATFHRNEIYAWLGANGALVRLRDHEDEVKPRRGTSKRSSDSPAVHFGGADDVPPPLPNEATDYLSSTWAHLRTRLANALLNLCMRFPDAPTATSRAIARAGQSPDTRFQA